MKTVGKYIKSARVSKKYSISRVEEETRIKKSFIRAIETGEWQELPNFPIVLGFVKNLSEFLELNQARATALLRRDYPPEKLEVNPKPDIKREFKWSPRLTFIAAILIVIFIVASYLGLQYKVFTSSPDLIVNSPESEQEIYENNITVTGQTDSGATVRINNQPTLIDSDGNFSIEIDIVSDTTEIEIRAISRSGKETVIYRKIKPKF